MALTRVSNNMLPTTITRTVPSSSITGLGSLASKNSSLTFDYTKKATLNTGITISNTTPTWTYTLSSYFTMPADVVSVILRVRYVHSGSTNHGYLEFNSYQSGYSSNYATYQASHYDWYYNTTNEFIFVPWQTSATNDLILAVTSSYNSSGSNTYNIYVDGIVRGAI